MFSAAALPFAALKTNIVSVELQNQPIFKSELQYLAAPYLSVTGAMSVAVGVGVFGVLGWRNSARKLVSAEATKGDLSKNLATYQAELERIKFSDARLRTQNLSGFLQPESSWVEPSEPVLTVAAAPQPVKSVHRVPQPLAQPRVSVVTAQPTAVPSGYAKVEPSEPARPTPSDPRQESLETVLTQLQYLSRQVEELRKPPHPRHFAA